MEFVIASNNGGKVAEVKRILAAGGHTGLSLREAGVRLNVEETGETFAENAALKAAAACKATGKVALGDDSGLVVDSLDGAPGIYSARFAGEGATDEQNNKKLLQLLERTPYAARGAHFMCVVALATPEGGSMEVEGRCDGMIGFMPEGSGGFGYDPLFFYEGKSFATMTEEEKDAVSHRATALRTLMDELHRVGLAPPPAEGLAPAAAPVQEAEPSLTPDPGAQPFETGPPELETQEQNPQ